MNRMSSQCFYSDQPVFLAMISSFRCIHLVTSLFNSMSSRRIIYRTKCVRPASYETKKCWDSEELQMNCKGDRCPNEREKAAVVAPLGVMSICNTGLMLALALNLTPRRRVGLGRSYTLTEERDASHVPCHLLGQFGQSWNTCPASQTFLMWRNKLMR